MFGRVGVVLVPFLLLGVWLVQRSRHTRRPLELDPSRQDAVLASHRKAVSWRWAGLGLGVAAAAFTVSVGSLGLGVMLAPTVFGICVIAGVVVGELATIPRRAGVRTAALETRTVRNYLPRRLGGLVTASTLGLGALLVTTTLMGSADDMGRAGRSLFRSCSTEMSAGAGPWPGLFYSVPLGIAVAVGLLGAAVALRTVVLRPRSGSAPDFLAADDVLRRRSAEAVVAATGVMVAASLFGVALAAGGALLRFTCPPSSWTVLGGTLLAVGALMLFLAVWCLALLLSKPRIRLMVSADTAAAGPAARR
ncbi:MAG: hypothetical protein ACYCV4_08055 [Dermatophilaceae bacterium]